MRHPQYHCSGQLPSPSGRFRKLVLVSTAPLAILALVACSVSRQASQADQPLCQLAAQPPVLEFRLSTAGPYGETWRVTLREFSELPPEDPWVEVCVDFHSFAPSGRAQASFLLSAERYREVLAALDDAKFHELPEVISQPKVALHMPSLEIVDRRQDTPRSVELYNPTELTGRLEVPRFMRVWDSLFNQLPLSTKWKP